MSQLDNYTPVAHPEYKFHEKCEICHLLINESDHIHSNCKQCMKPICLAKQSYHLFRHLENKEYIEHVHLYCNDDYMKNSVNMILDPLHNLANSINVLNSWHSKLYDKCMKCNIQYSGECYVPEQLHLYPWVKPWSLLEKEREEKESREKK